MGLDSATRIKLFIQDLKESWYFRVWIITWLVCAILSFVALILIAQVVTNANKYPVQRSYFSKSSELKFPTYQFKLHGALAVDYNCSHNGIPVTAVPCDIGGFMCIQVAGSQATAYNSKKYLQIPDNQRLDCTVVANASGLPPNPNYEFPTLHWLLADRSDTGGSNSVSDLVIQPSAWAWVELGRTLVDGKTYWDRSLLYHAYYNQTSPSGIYTFQVSTILARFFTLNLVNHVSFTGYNVLAVVGGFAFFTLLLHTALMFLVGFVLDNNSKFLADSAEEGDHHHHHTVSTGPSSPSE